MTRVVWTRVVVKQLERLPYAIVRKFNIWAALVEESGIGEVRKIKGFHDEPLKGDRQGQRSIRLNRSYRAIYREKNSDELELVEVLEVNKHEY